MSLYRSVVIWSVLVALGGAGEAVAPPPATPPVAPPVTTTTPPTALAVIPAIPPSPSTAPGVRIWPEPRFSHWPAVIYVGEGRNCSYELPVRTPGEAGSIAWEGGAVLPFVLPSAAERISGLIDLPATPGTNVAKLTIGAKTWQLPLRLVDASGTWPQRSLIGGFPVDAQGVPVVLVDRRRDPASEAKWKLPGADLGRPAGRPLVIGDPMEALGRTAWSGLDADCRAVSEERYPHHGVLVALADLPDPLPRTIVWSPGNNALFGAAWSEEEERILGVLRSRCERLGTVPRLVLVLPPLPIAGHELVELARRRRELLGRSAAFQSWTVLDAEAIVGPAAEANKVSDGVYTRHPNGAAQARLAQALAQVL